MSASLHSYINVSRAACVHANVDPHYVDANMSILPLDTPAPIVSANICHWTSEVRCERVVLCVETVFAVCVYGLQLLELNYFNGWSYPT